MKLHRNGTNWNRDERNKTNENWDEIEGNYNNVVENVSDKAFDKVVDSAKLNWKEPVDTLDNLPSNAVVGDTRAVRENGYIYRYDGSQWKIIQEFDLSMIDDLETTIQRTASYTGISHKEMHKREIVLELPGRFDDYNAVMTSQTEYMHTQAFTVLEEDNLLFVLFVPPGESTLKSRWIAVYDWLTGEYLSCFGVISEGWEGIVVKYEDSKRFLYVGGINEVRGYDLHKYDITQLPENLELLTEFTKVELGIHHRFNYHNGKWLVSKDTETTVYSNGSRSFWQILDDDFNVIKNIRVDGKMRSLMNKTTTSIFPKVQGLAIGSDFLVASFGATTQGNNISHNNLQQGIVLLDTNGNIAKSGSMDNEKLLNKYTSLGYKPNKVENEGVWVSENNEIYTLNVINTTDPSKGLLIIKEGSNNRMTKDFSEVSAPLYSLDVDKYGDRYFPVTDGYFVNPVTQEKFTNITEMVAFARDYDLPSISVYVSPETNLLGINNEKLSAVYFHFKNVNSFTLFGIEKSTNGQRNLVFSRGNIHVLPNENKKSLINAPIKVERGKVISLNGDLDSFSQLEFVYQTNGYDNRVHVFDMDAGVKGKYDIRDFNMADSLSSESIIFVEIFLERVSNENKLKIEKCIKQNVRGVENSKKENITGEYLIQDIKGVY